MHLNIGGRMFFNKNKKNLNKLLEELRPSLIRLATAWSNNSALAEDLVQETMLKSFKNADQLRDYEKFDSWVFSILNNCWREYLRKEKPTVEIDDVVMGSSNVTELHVNKVEIIERVRRAVSLLPNSQRQVVTLVDLQGFSYAEVSEILDIPTGTVMSRLSRARENLKRYLTSLNRDFSGKTNKLRTVK